MRWRGDSDAVLAALIVFAISFVCGMAWVLTGCAGAACEVETSPWRVECQEKRDAEQD